MPVPIWAGRYIGLPFLARGRDRRGLDCWGLVRLALAEQFALQLPCFAKDYAHATDSEKIATVARGEIPRWRAIAPGDEALGDVIVLRLRGVPMHVGLVIGDGQMLHIEASINSAIERYTGLRWRDRVEGFYRYRTYLDDLEYASDSDD